MKTKNSEANAPLYNVPRLPVGEIVRQLSDAYTTLLVHAHAPSLFPSVMLWGPPGVGKSQAVRQIAGRIEKMTKKKVQVTDVRLLLFNPIDLRGIPTANEDKTLAVWLKPQIFQMDPSEKIVNILFLDEISAAPPSVQAAAYQITLDRVVGEHRLPDNCIVIAAGNRITDKSVAYQMPKALANRLLHIEVEESFTGWAQWAVANGIHEKVLGFLTFRQDYLMGFNTQTEDLAYATPRTWEMVSNLLQLVGDDPETIFPMIAGLVGCGAATEFRTWCRIYHNLPDIAEIFDGTCMTVPRETDVLYALVSSMTVYAREHKEEMGRISNSILYADRMPPDFAALLLRNYMYIEEGYKTKLLRIPVFARWLRTKGSMMNGCF